jgi:VWFA-related protein
MTKSNITIYSINTRGIYSGESDPRHEDYWFVTNDPTVQMDYQDSLASIATETGGLSFLNTSNFAKAFDGIVSDLNHQYLICYRPPDHKNRGEYHNIRVTCSRKDVHLRYRQGYVD